MKELARAIEAFKSKRIKINDYANGILARDSFVLQGKRPDPETLFSSMGGFEFYPVTNLINIGMGVWAFFFDQMIEETASYVADLTGGRKVRRESLREEVQYYKEVAKEGLDTLKGKPAIVWGLN